MDKSFQRGAAHILFLLILLAGIAVGVYLITQGNPLKLFSKATNPPVVFKSVDGQDLPKNSAIGVAMSTSATVKIEFTSPLGPAGNIGIEPVPTSSPSPTPVIVPSACTVCSADANKDGYVNILDFSLIKPCRSKPVSGACANADVNGDKQINDEDIACFQSNVGKKCSPSTAPTPFVCTACAADINKDGQVNITDATRLSGCYRKAVTGDCFAADINKDGKVNAGDYACLTSQFNKKCEVAGGTNSKSSPLPRLTPPPKLTPPPLPVKITTISYRFAETITELDAAAFIPYTQDPMAVTYTFKDVTPAPKFIWVDFKDSTGKVERKTGEMHLLKPEEKAVSFSNGSHLTVADPEKKLALIQDGTVELWFRPNKTGGTIISMVRPNQIFPSYLLLLSEYRSEGVMELLYNGSSAEIRSSQIPVNTWSHLAFTKTGQTVKGYLNGQKVFEKGGWQLADLSSIDPTLVIGSGYSGYNGAIYDLRFSNTVRNIEQNWKDGLYTKQLQVDSNTIALWNFQGDLKDASQNKLDGVAVGNVDYISRETGLSLTPTPIPTLIPTPTPIVIKSDTAWTPPRTIIKSDTVYDLGVLVIKYFPLTPDKQNIDINVTGDVGDLYTTIRQKSIDITNNLLSVLSKASSYLGYKNINSQPTLNYHIVDTHEYIQAVPIKPRSGFLRYPDYNAIMTTHKICDYVDNKGVREVWLWAYQGPNKVDGQPFLRIWESKMSGPNGDISNSDQYNDMPICKSTYRVYTFNYGRGTAEAMESWGHQMEAELSAVDSNLFRNIFQGQNYPQTLKINGRCGSVHNPPNAEFEYDRGNPAPNKSDCLDWNPDSLGQLSSISCQNWGCQQVSDSNNPSLNYMIWNWQNLPGANNNKIYRGKQLRNWWDIHGDFDNVLKSSRRLTLD